MTLELSLPPVQVPWQVWVPWGSCRRWPRRGHHAGFLDRVAVSRFTFSGQLSTREQEGQETPWLAEVVALACSGDCEGAPTWTRHRLGTTVGSRSSVLLCWSCPCRGP